MQKFYKCRLLNTETYNESCSNERELYGTYIFSLICSKNKPSDNTACCKLAGGYYLYQAENVFPKFNKFELKEIANIVNNEIRKNINGDINSKIEFSGDTFKKIMEYRFPLKEINPNHSHLHLMNHNKEKLEYVICERYVDATGNYFMREITTGEVFPLASANGRTTKYSGYIEKEHSDSYRIYFYRKFYMFNKNGYRRLRVYSVLDSLASQEEVMSYTGMYNRSDSILKKIRVRSNLNKRKKIIYYCSVENQIHENGIDLTRIDDEIVSRPFDEFFSILENIEVRLLELKNKNLLCYIELQKRYDVLTEDSNLNLEMLLNFQKSLDDINTETPITDEMICKYINSIIDGYRKSINGTDNFCYTLYDVEDIIDLVGENVLKDKLNVYKNGGEMENTMSSIIEGISVLYILSIVTNRGNYSMEELKNTHIEMFIPCIKGSLKLVSAVWDIKVNEMNNTSLNSLYSALGDYLLDNSSSMSTKPFTMKPVN